MPEQAQGVRIVRSPQRQRTLALEVHPGGEVVLRAPADCPPQRIEAFLHKRAAWIAAQQRYFQELPPATPARAWVPGESHRHLGRRYQLRWVKGKGTPVQLSGQELLVSVDGDATNRPAMVRKAVERWRQQQARHLFAQLLTQCLRHRLFEGCPAPRLRVQRLERRWGSLSPGGTLTLNHALIQAPLVCIRYVIWHELCHLLQPNHSPAFFRLLEEVCPRWQQHRMQLEKLLR